MAADWPLVGRQAQLGQVEGVLGRSDRSGVVLAGPAGVGKTRLATECLAIAKRMGFATVRANATRAAATIPFGALAPLLPVEQPSEPQAIYLRRAAAAIASLGQGAPVMLVLDDAHLLDDPSAILAHQIAQAQLAFVVVTLRTGERTPDPVVALWKDALAERIDISTLSLEDVTALMDNLLDGDVDPAVPTSLWRTSGGNPLYLRELVASALDTGAIAKVGDRWRLRGELAASARINELIATRLAEVDDDQRRVLEIVAFGEDVSIDTLERLGGDAPIERLERRGLIELVSDGRRRSVRLSHPLYGEVVRAEAPALRARDARRKLADAIEAHGARRREDVLQVATWRLEGGGRADPDLMLAAARRARSLSDLDLATRLARAAEEAGGGPEASVVVAECLTFAGRTAEAEQQFETLTSELETDEQRSAVALMRFENDYFGIGAIDHARAHLAQAKASITDPDRRMKLALREAEVAYHSGRLSESLAMLDPILEAAEGRTFVSAVSSAAWIHTALGHSKRVIELIDRAEAVLETLPASSMHWHRDFLMMTRSATLSRGGFLHEARQLALARHEALRAAGDVRSYGPVAFSMAETLTLTGELVDARRWVDEGIEAFRRNNRPFLLLWGLGNAAVIRGHLGDADGADEIVAQMDVLAPHALPMFAAPMGRGRAWAAAARGELTRAREHLLHAVEGAYADEVRMLHDLARLGAPKAACERLACVRGRIEGPLPEATVAHAEALAADDGDASIAVARRFEDIGAILFAAEAAAAASASFIRHGDARKARAAEAQAGCLAARTQGARTPALMTIGLQATLTPREIEVATLAAAGVANADIAERLSLSVRTVHNQLQRAYEKLGIHSRAALADKLVGVEVLADPSGPH